MKILAINGSPRGKNSNTDKLLIPFLKGAQAGNADVEEIYLSQKNISGCHGCFACWVKTPGKCILKDDMPELLDKVNNADVMIFATPLYDFSMSGQMKIFIDRLLPIIEPFFSKRNGKMAPSIRRSRSWKTILISNEGFLEKEHFDILVSHMNKMASFWGECDGLCEMILRTQGECMKQPKYKDKMKEITKALEKAGKEFAVYEKINKKTLDIIEQPFSQASLTEVMDRGNKMWERLISENTSMLH